MICINLLGAARQSARKAPVFDLSQRVNVLCGLVLVIAAAGIGGWYWMLRSASARVDAEIAAAEQETARLRPLLAEVEQYEARLAEQQERVALIQQLRSGQSIPVQVLDHVSRSLPESLWLTAMNQEGGTLTLEGRSTTLIALSDFVGNLGGAELLQKPIEIISSQVESGGGGRDRAPVELIRFVVRAQVTQPPDRTDDAKDADTKKKRAGRDPRAAKAARG
jgi:type IV pilus assembly protein PilN